jgi:hypothetical protein
VAQACYGPPYGGSAGGTVKRRYEKSLLLRLGGFPSDGRDRGVSFALAVRETMVL